MHGTVAPSAYDGLLCKLSMIAMQTSSSGTAGALSASKVRRDLEAQSAASSSVAATLSERAPLILAASSSICATIRRCIGSDGRPILRLMNLVSDRRTRFVVPSLATLHSSTNEAVLAIQ